MKQLDCHLEIRGVATKGRAHLAAISAKAIVVFQTFIKVVGEFCRPKRIEGLRISCFSLFLLTHFIENCCLFFNQKFEAIGKPLPGLAHKFESLGIVPLFHQLLHIPIDNFKSRRVLGECLLIESRRKIFLQRMCLGQIDQSSEDFDAVLWRSNL